MEAMRQRDGADLESSARAAHLSARLRPPSRRRARRATQPGVGKGCAVALRDKYTPQITDYTAFARHVDGTPLFRHGGFLEHRGREDRRERHSCRHTRRHRPS